MRTLKVLIVSDHESEYIWEYFDREAFKGVELIISCGDLKPEYLSFLVTMLPVPLLYVPGNHDERYQRTPPEGCIDLEEYGVYIYKGFRFLGYGGCKSDARKANQYTEREMRNNVLKTLPSILWRGGFDVLVTHASAEGLGDGDDRFHKGFRCFRRLIDTWEPAYHLHGHVHLSYCYRQKRVEKYKNTTIINGFNYIITDLELPDKPKRRYFPKGMEK
ncbi:MAG: metallophosphoesterase family protein [Clostridiaceae bacterium]|nr:metallophosphoesterase family protein [Clostridiaceae bacterium]